MHDDGGSVRRRAVLAGAGVALAGGAGRVASLAAGRGGDGPPVSMLAAGSLHDALVHGLVPRIDVELRVEARGSAALARLVADGAKDPDLVAVADVALFDGPLDPAWYAEVATNALVLAYDPSSRGGRRIAAAGADGWFRPLLDGEVALGRTDPDLDPLGYRTLFALELATDHYDTDADLRAAIPRREQVYPETRLLAQFETGGIEAAFAYRSMAVSRGYEYVDLPTAVDLSDPGLARRYARVSYDLPADDSAADDSAADDLPAADRRSRRTVRGAPISYGSTARHRSPAADAAFRAHAAAATLPEFGFRVPEEYPRYAGDVPDGLR